MDEADDMEALLIHEGRQMSVYQSRKTSAPGWTRLRLAQENAATKVLKELAEREELNQCIGARFLRSMHIMLQRQCEQHRGPVDRKGELLVTHA